MNIRIFQTVALLCLTFALGAYAQHMHGQPKAPAHNHDLENGRQLYTTCIACHGANGEGNAQLKAPRIGGQLESYTISQLNSFKSGKRGAHPDDPEGALMVPVVAGRQRASRT